MIKRLILLTMLAIPAPSTLAEQPQHQPDAAMMQRVIASLQQQRNAALDAVALGLAREEALNEELSKLKAQLVEELKKAGQTKEPAESKPAG